MSSHVWEIVSFGFSTDVEFIQSELHSTLEGARARVESRANLDLYKPEWHESEYGHSCTFRRRRTRNKYAACSFLIVRRAVIS